MRPYYEDERAGIVLYCGDCREVLPTLPDGFADLCATDPPYGVNFRGEAWDAEIPDWLPEARRVARAVLFTTGTTTLWDYPRPDWVLDWQRPASNSRSCLGGFSHWSPVLVYGEVKFPVDCFRLHACAVGDAHKREGIAHPSPKPVALFRWLLEHASRPGDLTLDPFAGSGSSLVAAKQMGRRAVGVEIDERHCESAARRLRNTTPPLFTLETAPDPHPALALEEVA